MIHDPVIVGDREIPETDIAAEVQHHPAADAEAAWKAAAEALVVRQLLLDEAERLEIAAVRLPDGTGRTMAEEDARIDALLEREITVPQADEETCLRYYGRHQPRFTSPTQAEAEHILFAVKPDDEIAMGLAISDARSAIRSLCQYPEAFADLAREHSACPSGKDGGKLGMIGPGDTVEPFEQALFSLAEGELCPVPVKSRFGVHVIRAGRRIDGETLPFEAVRGKIADYLEEASYRRAVAQYVAILAAKAGVQGITLASVDGPLVQ